MCLKSEPQTAQFLRAAYEAVAPGYYLNKRHWNTIALKGDAGGRDIKGLGAAACWAPRPSADAAPQRYANGRVYYAAYEDVRAVGGSRRAA